MFEDYPTVSALHLASAQMLHDLHFESVMLKIQESQAVLLDVKKKILESGLLLESGFQESIITLMILLHTVQESCFEAQSLLRIQHI